MLGPIEWQILDAGYKLHLKFCRREIPTLKSTHSTEHFPAFIIQMSYASSHEMQNFVGRL